jgi:uncharacterized protein (TIGR02284 family)
MYISVEFKNRKPMKTTREAAKEEIHKNLVNNLQDLLEKNYDAEEGFKKAMHDAKDPNLKEFLKRQAVQRNHFATELDKAIHSLNEHPREKGSTEGTLHRAWIDFKTAFTKNDDEAVLEECIRGEKASLKEYEHKLEHNNFSPEILNTLNEHKAAIKSTIATVERLEDLVDD